MKKIIFVILFVPVHLFLTISLIQWYLFNYNPNVHTALWQQLCRILAFVFAQPIVWPVIITDLFEYWPIFIPLFFHFLNSLIWALAILAVFGKVRHLGKPIFFMVFVPLHSCWTAILLACYWFKYDWEVYTSFWGKLLHIMSFIFSLPIVWPMILSDEAAHSPTWIQFLFYILNSVIWAVVLFLIYSRLKRLLARKIKRHRLEPSVAV